MGGNVAEFTTEVMPSTSEPAVLRSGYYSAYFYPAGQRFDVRTLGTSSYAGLRATLFLK